MFQNEITFVRMQKAGKEAEFHRLYEEALKEAEKYLHKEYPNIIGKEIIEKEKIKDISPIDGKEIATFQMASPENINRALEMLHSSWKKWYELGYVERARIMLKEWVARTAESNEQIAQTENFIKGMPERALDYFQVRTDHNEIVSLKVDQWMVMARRK